MISFRVYGGLTGSVFAVAGLAGCLISAEPISGPGPAPAPRSGTLTVAWTVNDSRSPAACAQFGADDVEVVVRDQANRPVATVTAPCADFTLTVPLPAGTYEGEATLVDSRSRALTTTLPLHDIDIHPGPDLTIEIDFPASSRL
jgi:hypothetical protein